MCRNVFITETIELLISPFQEFKLVKVKMSSVAKQETIPTFISLFSQHLNLISTSILSKVKLENREYL